MAANFRHNDPATWRSRAVDQRGWTRIECVHCGRFVGWKPDDATLKSTNKKTKEFDERPTITSRLIGD